MAFFEDELAEAMSGIRRAADGVARVQEHVATARATVRSRNRLVSATVDSQGKLVGLSLHGDRYRTMPAVELTNLILDTVAAAHAQCAEEMSAVLQAELGDEWGAFDPSAPLGADYDEVFSRTVLDRLPGLSESEIAEVRRSWKEQA